MRGVREIALSGVLGLLLSGARPAGAVLVIFADGRVLRAQSFELADEERIALSLSGGGRLTIALEMVDRIVDEEYERPPDGSEPERQRLASAEDARFRRSVRAFEETLPPSFPYSKEIRQAASEYRIDPLLIAAVIKAESNFDAGAVSRKGARGLMQLMPATARRLGVVRSFDPRENIRGGAAYLAELAERFGETSVELILAAYNAGERAVTEFGGVPPYRETRAYVRRVTAFWQETLAARTAS